MQQVSPRQHARHLQAINLDCACCRTRAATHEHQEKEQAERERSPSRVIGAEEAGRGDDRGDIKARQPQGFEQGDIPRPPQPERHHQHNYDDEADKAPHLSIAPGGTEVAVGHPDERDERQCAQDHEYYRRCFQGRGCKEAETFVMCRKAGRGDRSQRVADGIEEGHAEHGVGHSAAEQQHQVNACGCHHQLSGPGQNFFGAIRSLGQKELHSADAQEWENDDRGYDDAEPADSLQQGTPKQQTPRKPIEADDDGRARRGQTGHGFEEGVRVGEAYADERNSGEAGRKKPSERRQEERLLDTKFERLVSHCGEHHQPAHERRKHGRCEEHAPVIVGICRIDDRWYRHCSGQRA